MRKGILMLLIIGGLLTACSNDGPQESDFYTYVRSDYDGAATSGNEVWLGIDIEQQRVNVGNQDAGASLKVYYREGELRSMTSISREFKSKLGMKVMETTDAEAEEILKAVSGTAVYWDERDMLCAEKTIDGVLYTMRIYFYKDRSIKGMNVCTDTSLEDFANKPGW